ncbi:MAG: hypothetical protein M5U34_16330 [Chloroflexi bacterium]|nr:hypothetical protein [Chloroflexota bacterium]
MSKFTININETDTDLEVTRQGDHLHITFDGETAEVELVYSDGPRLLLEQVMPRRNPSPHPRRQPQRQRGSTTAVGKRPLPYLPSSAPTRTKRRPG